MDSPPPSSRPKSSVSFSDELSRRMVKVVQQEKLWSGVSERKATANSEMDAPQRDAARLLRVPFARDTSVRLKPTVPRQPRSKPHEGSTRVSSKAALRQDQAATSSYLAAMEAQIQDLRQKKDERTPEEAQEFERLQRWELPSLPLSPQPCRRRCGVCHGTNRHAR